MFKILLSHDPTFWESTVLPQTDIDLTLSGHTHAWQFRLWGISPSMLMFHQWAGLYTAPTTASSVPAAAPSTPAPASSAPAAAPSTPAPATSAPATAPSTPATASSIPAAAPSIPAPASSAPATAPSTPAPASSAPAAAPSIPAPASSAPNTAPNAAHAAIQKLFVSTGSGGNIPFRFGSWPEIDIITLRRSPSASRNINQ